MAVDTAVPRCLQPVELLVHLEGSGALTFQLVALVPHWLHLRARQ